MLLHPNFLCSFISIFFAPFFSILSHSFSSILYSLIRPFCLLYQFLPFLLVFFINHQHHPIAFNYHFGLVPGLIYFLWPDIQHRGGGGCLFQHNAGSTLESGKRYKTSIIRPRSISPGVRVLYPREIVEIYHFFPTMCHAISRLKGKEKPTVW